MCDWIPLPNHTQQYKDFEIKKNLKKRNYLRKIPETISDGYFRSIQQPINCLNLNMLLETPYYVHVTYLIYMHIKHSTVHTHTHTHDIINNSNSHLIVRFRMLRNISMQNVQTNSVCREPRKMRLPSLSGFFCFCCSVVCVLISSQLKKVGWLNVRYSGG